MIIFVSFKNEIINQNFNLMVDKLKILEQKKAEALIGGGQNRIDAQHKKACESFAKKILKKSMEKIGKGLTVDMRHVFNVNLFEGIIETAKKAKGDVIVMASNKNTGLKGILLGSETHAVIVHSNLPVLVLG